jgi:hypothetical protein
MVSVVVDCILIPEGILVFTGRQNRILKAFAKPNKAMEQCLLL